ncbi:ABC transporter substrate-binding protein [Maridesulfovibrio frigidus]|uniref:ABC transporter substrate-binding protein n=1 Tax=Maridesulfovibrio frigidus TaxID=340956 RepID=UPI000A0225E6|nr:ABC transporter substrate-binding protein [Maridesulfovibrio frigidus]
MKIYTLFLFCCISCLFLPSCSQQKEDYNIGAILVLSSKDSAEFSNEHQVLTGMKVAIDKINNTGGIRGRKVNLIVRDCKRESEIARKQAVELLEYKPIAIVSIYSHIAQALTDIAAKNNITHIAALASAENIVNDAPHSFRYGPWASIEVKAALPIIYKLNAKKIGLINIDNLYGNSVSNQLAELVHLQGITTKKVSYQKINEDLKNKLRQLDDVDLIYFSCFPADMSALLKTIREVLPGLPIIAPNIAASPIFASKPELDGVYLAAPLIYNSSFPFIVDINKLFTEKTGQKITHYLAIGYDLINLLTQLILRSEESPPALTKELLAGFVYPGLFGDVINKAGSHEFSFPLYPARIQNGTIVYQER